MDFNTIRNIKLGLTALGVISGVYGFCFTKHKNLEINIKDFLKLEISSDVIYSVGSILFVYKFMEIYDSHTRVFEPYIGPIRNNHRLTPLNPWVLYDNGNIVNAVNPNNPPQINPNADDEEEEELN